MREQAPGQRDIDPTGHPPTLEGSLAGRPPSALLVEIEHLRTSGVLQFEVAAQRGALTLIAGMIAEAQEPMASGDDPLDVLLAAKSGTYALYQRLRPLPISKGNDQRRTGSLQVHVPAELMNYCEASGITGTLTVEQAGKTARIGYRAGELDEILVDGSDEQDLHNIFAWNEGTFTIELEQPKAQEQDTASRPKPTKSQPPAPPTPAPFGPPGGREPTGAGFLNVVEVALDSILAEREKHRPPSPTQTIPLEPPKVRSSVSGEFDAIEEASQKREPTVRVIYLGDGPAETVEPVDASTIHVGGRLSEPEDERYLIDPLVEASEVRRPSGEAQPQASLTIRIARALGWTAVLLVLMFAALLVLANLPQL